jgi:hypothetical protein
MVYPRFVLVHLSKDCRRIIEWSHKNGRLAEGPIALAEVQGYVYAAKRLAALWLQGYCRPYLRGDAGGRGVHGIPAELFCGFRRRRNRGPTLYPVACWPQAWAAAAPFALLQASLGLEFDPDTREIRLRNPHLPSFIEALTINRLRLGDHRRLGSAWSGRRRVPTGPAQRWRRACLGGVLLAGGLHLLFCAPIPVAIKRRAS